MIDVQRILKQIPHFETFCSVEKLHAMVHSLKEDSRFVVRTVGSSNKGHPIHHVRFGRGTIKALFVAFPHCKEPICGLTVYSLMSLLQQGNEALCRADVEWHIVPCVDPDGALLNETWTQRPIDMESYMKGFYVQALQDQVDTSFPLEHKKLIWDAPSREASLLRGLLDEIRPDFFYSLHNAWIGGAFYFLSRDLGRECHEALYELLEQQHFPLQTRPMWREVCAQFGPGIAEGWSIKKHYDHLQKTMPNPQDVLKFGGGSWDYLAQIKPDAITLIAEMGYVLHPGDESDAETGQNLRQFKLRIDADSKFLASLLLEEWEKVKSDVDITNPLYRAVIGGGVLPAKDSLNDGGRPMSMQPTRDVLFNSHYDRPMKEGDRFQACMIEGGFWFLCHSYQLVRLLKASRQTPAIKQSVDRIERAFDAALAELRHYVDFDAFEVIDCDTLARVQLGSGLVVLNSLLKMPLPPAS